MPSLFVGYGWCESVSLFGVNMHHGGFVGVLHATEHLDEFFHIVAFLQIFVFKAPCLKPVVLASAVALTQGTQIFVDSTMVFGNRHFVVVHHDDNACAQFRSFVKSLKRLTAR